MKLRIRTRTKWASDMKVDKVLQHKIVATITTNEVAKLVKEIAKLGINLDK